MIFLIKVFNVLTGVRDAALMVTGHERAQMFIAIICAILNILFCYIGTMISMIIQCLMELVAVKVLLGIWSFVSFSYLTTFFKMMRQ